MELFDKERERVKKIYDGYIEGFSLMNEIEEEIKKGINPLKELDRLKDNLQKLNDYQFYNIDYVLVNLINEQLLKEYSDKEIEVYITGKDSLSIHAYDFKLLELDLNSYKIKLFYDKDKFINSNRETINKCENDIESANEHINRLNSYLTASIFKLPKSIRLSRFKNKAKLNEDIKKSIDRVNENIKIYKENIEKAQLKIKIAEVMDEKLLKIQKDIVDFIKNQNNKFKYQENGIKFKSSSVNSKEWGNIINFDNSNYTVNTLKEYYEKIKQ